MQVADVQETRGRCRGVEFMTEVTRAAMYCVRTNALSCREVGGRLWEDRLPEVCVSPGPRSRALPRQACRP